MKLIIFPGAGNPGHQAYAEVYALISDLALEAGFRQIDLSVRWLGQFSPDASDRGGASTLELRSASEAATSVIDQLENEGEPYAVLGRSFGTFVILDTLSRRLTSALRKVILWGPCSYWKMWELFVAELETYKPRAMRKHVRIDASLFPSILPVESLLPNAAVETVVATGENDEYCPPVFLNYLTALTAQNPKVRCHRPVAKAPHEVTRALGPAVVADYGRALFGEM